VLVGVGLSIVLHVVRQSSRLRMRQLQLVDGRMRETAPPAEVPGGQVVVLQPYGSIFFATAPALEEQLPAVTGGSAGSVVILRLRGVDDAGATFVDVLTRFAAALRGTGSRLMLVSDNPRFRRQLQVTGALDVLGGSASTRATSGWGGPCAMRTATPPSGCGNRARGTRKALDAPAPA